MLNSETSLRPQKIVVFDLDETLGSFYEIGIFWIALEKYYDRILLKEHLFEVMEIFDEFLRPNILNTLAFVKEQKINNECDHVMIYTNNQGPKRWVKMLSDYFNMKLNYELFDKIIAAFKIQDKVIEILRTSHAKSVDDLIRCTKIPSNTDICFIDDQIHPLMEQDNVYYINVKPYSYSLPFEQMAQRYYDAYIKDRELKTRFVSNIIASMRQSNFIVTHKSDIEQNTDTVVSKQLLIHLENFFKKGRAKNARKHNASAKSKTARKKNTLFNK